MKGNTSKSDHLGLKVGGMGSVIREAIGLGRSDSHLGCQPVFSLEAGVGGRECSHPEQRTGHVRMKVF